MKKHVMSAISKLTLGVLLFMSVAAGTQAATVNPGDKIAEVKYIGTSDDAVLFNVSVDNPTGSKFSIIVLDGEGDQIFQEIYSDKKFDKKFRLPKSEKNKLTFVIRNFKTADVRQTFEINTKYIEDVVVTKL
ncbi:MAG: hypothetical protein JST75_01310 [Bacteroidetes bacterium]|nr:hypothetical protein [Bacteroidota bacterium]